MCDTSCLAMFPIQYNCFMFAGKLPLYTFYRFTFTLLSELAYVRFPLCVFHRLIFAESTAFSFSSKLNHLSLSFTMSTESESRKALLLDGGFSNELINNCNNYDIHKEPLWTARALIRDHDAIEKTHLAFLQAGADVIETSTYQASVPGFKEFHGIDGEEAENLMKGSVKIAHLAVDSFINSQVGGRRNRRPLVAGSVGPYGAYLRDGSEYTGSYMEKTSKAQLIDFHLPRIRALVDGGSDLLLLETIPSLVETSTLLELIQNQFPNIDVWTSFSVKATDPMMTPGNEPLTLVFDTIKNFPQVKGFGINCCAPKNVSPFLQTINALKANTPSAKDIKLLVYPNSGDDWIRGTGWVKSDAPRIDSYARKWLEEGANVIGGCCQVGPLDIGKLRVILDQWNSEN